MARPASFVLIVNIKPDLFCSSTYMLLLSGPASLSGPNEKCEPHSYCGWLAGSSGDRVADKNKLIGTALLGAVNAIVMSRMASRKEPLL